MDRIIWGFVFAFSLALSLNAEERVPRDIGEMRLSFAPVVRTSAPSVVNIYAKRVVETAANPFANDPFFSDLFRNFGDGSPRVQSSLGSGVIVAADGLVVSNFHVVGGASDIRVVLSDRREYDAEILLADEQSDLAILRIIADEALPAMELRTSDDVEVGELVLAIGNPFGVGQTVSSGIILGLARSGAALGNARAYFIQTDAPINPGNSGGALVDMNGALVGINTSILTRSGGSNGIGFAIPADLVAVFIDQARQGHQRFQRPWAGMVGQTVDWAMADSFGLERPRGMVIADLHIDSPFAAAGLSPGDVVLGFQGVEINGPAEMLYNMSITGIGERAEVTFLRDGKTRKVAVEMIVAPEEPPRELTIMDGNSPLHGLTIARINPALIAELGLPMNAAGVIVIEVGGFAARLGFQPRDLLVAINGIAIQSVADAKAWEDDNSRHWDIEIDRAGQRLSMRVRR